MIVTRTPLRISFVGGGSDLPAFYREEPGAVVSATIDKYVYVAVNPKFDGAIRAAYSITEDATDLHELQHDLIRESLWQHGPTQGVEIHSIADVPAGTGLGSSSAFTVGLIKALDVYRQQRKPAWTLYTPDQLVEEARHVELDRCHHPIGKQDHYAAAFGGLNLFRFLPDETVQVVPIACDYEALNSHLLLLYTGAARQGDAGQVLAGQQQDRDDVRELVTLAEPFVAALQEGDFCQCGAILNTAWMIKRRIIGNTQGYIWQIDHWYALASRAGAWGGKLCGAGGGGFLCFMAPPDRHAAIVEALGLRYVPFQTVPRGSQVVFS